MAVKWYFAKWFCWQHKWELVRWDHTFLTRGMALREDKRGHSLSFLSESMCKIVMVKKQRKLIMIIYGCIYAILNYLEGASFPVTKFLLKNMFPIFQRNILSWMWIFTNSEFKNSSLILKWAYIFYYGAQNPALGKTLLSHFFFLP